MENVEQRSRFKDLPWFGKYDQPISVLGCGGIGSWVVFFLTRAGFKVRVIDNDEIEYHNIGGQLFSPTQIGMKKVDAIKKNVNYFSQEYVTATCEFINYENFVPTDIVISCFDNMQARKDAFTKWRDITMENQNSKSLFMDGRLNAEYYEIFSVPGDKPVRKDLYFNTDLFDDADVEDLPCTAKQTSHMASSIASSMVTILTNWITNNYSDSARRVVPYKIRHSGHMLLTQKQMS